MGEVSESEDEKSSEPEPEVHEDAPKVELSTEEKQQWFLKSQTPDISASAMSASFKKFSLPSKAEGFDDIRYEWIKDAKKNASFLKDWVLGKKLTTRVESIKPSTWLQTENSKLLKQIQEWKTKSNEYKQLLRKKAEAKEARKRSHLKSSRKIPATRC